MNKILFATSNKNKVKEVNQIIGDEIKILSLNDMKDETDVEETENTFKGNALLKAKYFSIKHNIITIADDSGLVVNSLDYKPGIYSKRYSGLGDFENNKKVLKEMDGKIDRTAHFVCAICIYFPNNKFYLYEDYLHGEIAKEMKGTNGFGYDSILYIEEFKKTVAELDSETKNVISHRAKAINNIRRHSSEIINYK